MIAIKHAGFIHGINHLYLHSLEQHFNYTNSKKNLRKKKFRVRKLTCKQKMNAQNYLSHIDIML